MNVLYVVSGKGLYGANNSLLDMLDGIKTKGITPFVLVPGKGGLDEELRRRNIQYCIISCGVNASFAYDLAIIRVLKKCYHLSKSVIGFWKGAWFIKKNKIELVHSNNSYVDLGAVLAMCFGLPHVWHIRELLFEHYQFSYDFPIVSKYLLSKAAIFITISDYIAREKGMSNNVTIYNAINPSRYLICKKELFRDEIINLLFAGNISESKGIMDAVKAMEYLHDSGVENVHLSIVGEKTAYWKKTVEKYIKEKDLNKCITCYGFQRDMLAFRQKADIALMCSRSEGLGRVTVESMLGEVLVIGADCGATKEILENGVTGYLYEAGNYIELAQQIQAVYANKEKAMKIIQNAKAYAIKEFNPEKYSEKIQRVYESILRA